ncbi:MAG: hypothetical protein ACU0CI_04980 [Shimia sp.]
MGSQTTPLPPAVARAIAKSRNQFAPAASAALALACGMTAIGMLALT